MWAHKLIIHLKCPECIHAAKEMNTPSDLSSGAKLHSVASVAFLSNLEKKKKKIVVIAHDKQLQCWYNYSQQFHFLMLCCCIMLLLQWNRTYRLSAFTQIGNQREVK